MIPMQYALRRRMMGQGSKKELWWTVTVSGKFYYNAAKDVMNQGVRFNIDGTWYPASAASNYVEYNFTKQVKDGDIIGIQICANNNYKVKYVVNGTTIDESSSSTNVHAFEYVVHSDITLEGLVTHDDTTNSDVHGIYITSV